MKKLIIFFWGIASIYSNAQDSTVDEYYNEFLPKMGTAQRLALSAFESLKVIDTEENLSFVFKNNKWQQLFSKEAIQQAQKEGENKKNLNESWKKFDEESRPEGNNSVSNYISTEQSLPTNIIKNSIFRYEVITAEILSKNGFNFSLKSGEKIAYFKIYTKDHEIDIEGFGYAKFLEENSILYRPGIDSSEVSPKKLVITNKAKTKPLENFESINGILICYIN